MRLYRSTGAAQPHMHTQSQHHSQSNGDTLRDARIERNQLRLSPTVKCCEMRRLGTLAAAPGLLRVQSSGGLHKHCLSEQLPDAVVKAWVNSGAKSDHKSTEGRDSGLSLTVQQKNGFH